MWQLDCEESWAPKNWCFWTVVLEKTLSPLGCKEIQPGPPKGDQAWVFIGRTDAEAEIPILWPPDAKSWLIWKDPDAGKDWRQEEKGTQWTWVWVDSWSWWWTGKPGVLWFMGLQSQTLLRDWWYLKHLNNLVEKYQSHIIGDFLFWLYRIINNLFLFQERWTMNFECKWLKKVINEESDTYLPLFGVRF